MTAVVDGDCKLHTVAGVFKAGYISLAAEAITRFCD